MAERATGDPNRQATRAAKSYLCDLPTEVVENIAKFLPYDGFGRTAWVGQSFLNLRLASATLAQQTAIIFARRFVGDDYDESLDDLDDEVDDSWIDRNHNSWGYGGSYIQRTYCLSDITFMIDRSLLAKHITFAAITPAWDFEEPPAERALDFNDGVIFAEATSKLSKLRVLVISGHSVAVGEAWFSGFASTFDVPELKVLDLRDLPIDGRDFPDLLQRHRQIDSLYLAAERVRPTTAAIALFATFELPSLHELQFSSGDEAFASPLGFRLSESKKMGTEDQLFVEWGLVEDGFRNDSIEMRACSTRSMQKAIEIVKDVIATNGLNDPMS
jgi:hypothetical protein